MRGQGQILINTATSLIKLRVVPNHHMNMNTTSFWAGLQAGFQLPAGLLADDIPSFHSCLILP